VKLDTVRTAALALPDTTEEPHHHFGSFRVRGRIFITMPPGDGHIHVFPSEQDRELALAAYPAFTEKLLWGGKVVGLRITLAKAPATAVKAMVRQAYDHQSAKPLRPTTRRKLTAPLQPEPGREQPHKEHP
jgi:hypothetical protein